MFKLKQGHFKAIQSVGTYIIGAISTDSCNKILLKGPLLVNVRCLGIANEWERSKIV